MAFVFGVRGGCWAGGGGATRVSTGVSARRRAMELGPLSPCISLLLHAAPLSSGPARTGPALSSNHNTVCVAAAGSCVARVWPRQLVEVVAVSVALPAWP